MKKIRQLLLLFANYYFYFLLGCFMALRGFLLPEIKDDFNINYTTSSLMFIISAIPNFFISLFSGHIFALANKKILLCISTAVVAIFFLLIPVSNSYTIFLVFNLFMGLGTSLLITGINVSIIDVFESIGAKYKDNLMLLLHLIYSIGSSLVILFSGSLLKSNIGWRYIYFYIGIAFLITPLILIFSRYPTAEDNKTQQQSINLRAFLTLFFNKKMLFYAVAVFFYGGLEQCLIIWMPTFLQKSLNFDITSSTMTMLGFFLLFCIGRFSGTLIVHKVYKIRFLILIIILSLLCLIVSLISRPRFLDIDIFFSLSGLFLSVIFPTIQNQFIADFKDRISAATGIFFVANSTGALLLSLLIGILNDLFSVNYGIVSVLVFYIFIIPFLILAAKAKILFNKKAGSEKGKNGLNKA